MSNPIIILAFSIFLTFHNKTFKISCTSLKLLISSNQQPGFFLQKLLKKQSLMQSNPIICNQEAGTA